MSILKKTHCFEEHKFEKVSPLMYKLLLIDLYGEGNSYSSRLTQAKHRERERKNSYRNTFRNSY